MNRTCLRTLSFLTSRTYYSLYFHRSSCRTERHYFSMTRHRSLMPCEYPMDTDVGICLLDMRMSGSIPKSIVRDYNPLKVKKKNKSRLLIWNGSTHRRCSNLFIVGTFIESYTILLYNYTILSVGNSTCTSQAQRCSAKHVLI